VSTVPVTLISLVILPSSVSVAVTPAIGLNEVPSFILTLSAPLITGLSLLLTVTVIVLVAFAPLLSVTS